MDFFDLETQLFRLLNSIHVIRFLSNSFENILDSQSGKNISIELQEELFAFSRLLGLTVNQTKKEYYKCENKITKTFKKYKTLR